MKDPHGSITSSAFTQEEWTWTHTSLRATQRNLKAGDITKWAYNRAKSKQSECITRAAVNFWGTIRHIQYHPNTSIWLHQPYRMQEIEWDSGKWQWRPTCNNAPTLFYSYTTKQGYRAGIQNRIQPTRYDVKLRARGHSDQECKGIYSIIWHQWIPQKVSFFL